MFDHLAHAVRLAHPPSLPLPCLFLLLFVFCQYPFESSTTTQDLQQSVFTEDVRLREKAGWAAHTSLVPSLQQLNTYVCVLVKDPSCRAFSFWLVLVVPRNALCVRAVCILDPRAVCRACRPADVNCDLIIIIYIYIYRQLAELAATGHVVVLPPAGHRNDKLQNHYDDSAGVSVTSTSFQPPPGYVPTRTPPTRGVETRFRLTRSEFADPGGKVEMYNR